MKLFSASHSRTDFAMPGPSQEYRGGTQLPRYRRRKEATSGKEWPSSGSQDIPRRPCCATLKGPRASGQEVPEAEDTTKNGVSGTMFHHLKEKLVPVHSKCRSHWWRCSGGHVSLAGTAHSPSNISHLIMSPRCLGMPKCFPNTSFSPCLRRRLLP